MLSREGDVGAWVLLCRPRPEGYYVPSLLCIRSHCSEWVRSAMYEVPPQERQFRPTTVALPLATDFW